MPRPQLPAGTLGKIGVRERTPGRWTARAKGRTLAGKLVELVAVANSAEEAAEYLREDFRMLVGTALQHLTSDSTVAEAAEAWVERAENASHAGELRPQSVRSYRRDAALIRRACGAVTLGSFTPAAASAILTQQATEVTDASARRLRTRLRAVLDLAVQHGALTRNPIRELPRPHKRRNSISRTVLTPEHWQSWCDNVREYGANPRMRADWERLLEVASVCLTTGARIGEVMALRPRDVVEDGRAVAITGTLVDAHRQESTKDERQARIIPVPSWVTPILKRLAEEALSEDSPLWPTRRGRFDSNYERLIRQWRQSPEGTRWMQEHDLDEFTWKIFRRSASAMARDYGSSDLARVLLGHRSLNTTVGYYLPPVSRVDDQAARISERWAQSTPEYPHPQQSAVEGTVTYVPGEQFAWRTS